MTEANDPPRERVAELLRQDEWMRESGWGERHQVSLYLTAIAMGAIVGLVWPVVAGLMEASINPVLGSLLFVTFLGIPLANIARAFTDWRFLATVLAVNFLLVPIVVLALSRFVVAKPALLVGVLLVLLTPCIDYVVVFTGLAGGAREKLLAATPLLMFLQILLLPAYLWVIAGPEVVGAIDPRPFAMAFVLLIALPLTLAAVTQLVTRRRPASGKVERVASAAMVPLMMLTLAIVVGSQVFAVGKTLGSLIAVVPLFVAFVVVLAPLGALAARLARLDTPGRRAVSFSGATRNSLVVLPLALALPAPFALTPLVVVTQTLVELLAMIVMVRVVPLCIGRGIART